MSYYLFRKSCLAWILLSGLSCHALAQCPGRKQLQTTLQRLLVQADPTGQVGVLQNWQRQWQQCGYPPDSTYINGLLQLGLGYFYRYDFPTATQIGQQAVRLCRTRRSDQGIDQLAKALYRLGMVLTLANQLAAMDTLKQAIQQGQGIHQADRWVGNAYLYVAYAYHSAGDFQQALSCVKSGEQLAGNTNDRSLMAKLLEEKAKTLNELEQYGPARQAAERALVLSEQEGYPTVIARAYKLLSIIAQNQKQLADALRYGRRAFDIARTAKDPATPDYAVSLGELYYQLRQYEQAIAYFQFGVDNNTNSYAKAYSLGKLGQVYQKKKDYLRALQCYQQGLTGIPIGFRDSAITRLPQARSIRLADQKEYLLTLIQDKANAWLDYAEATNNNRQRLQYALDTYNIADQMIDFMRWEHTGQQSKLFWRYKTRSMYERAIETCLRLNNTEQAFRFFEKSRAAMLADKLNELGARQQLSKQQLEQEDQLKQLVSSQQTNLAAITASKVIDKVAYKNAQEALSNTQNNLDRFRKQLEASNPAYYRYKYDTTVTSLADLRSHLKKQEASFVTYFVGDSTLYVLSVTADTSMLLPQPLRKYGQNVQAFMKLLWSPDAMNRKASYTQFLALGNGLYNQLLAPLNLPAGRVIVSPDGSFVPFETLSRRPDKPDYLVNDYAFSYIYSARLLLKNSGENRLKTLVSQRDFLGIAPVNFASSLGQVALPRSDKALERIAEHFHASELLTHKAATRRAFLTNATDASVIHLFTHATADSSHQEPMLYFADSTLKLSDLGDGDLSKVQLVVLAACKTGVGANQRGEGVFSFARGFAALGVPSVLTTLWSVQNEATYKLTESFYEHLDEGLPKDVALQRAKQEWLKNADQTNQLPNIWAGLIIVGDTEPLVRTYYSAWMSIVSLLILAGLGGWLWRRQKRKTKSSVSLPHSV